MRYVIKNCPAYKPEIYKDCCDLEGNYKCQQHSDCVLKQIVEVVSTFKSSYADVVLDKLEIEEVDE